MTGKKLASVVVLAFWTVLNGSSIFTARAHAVLSVADVTDYGADTSGQKDSTAAFVSALKASSLVLVPCGKYRINWTIDSVTNVMIVGSGTCTALYPAQPRTPVLLIKKTNFSEFRDFSVVATAGSSASGIVISASHNTQFRNIYVSGFQRNGLECVGDTGSGSSGVSLSGGYYLSNGMAGVAFSNCQDFHIAEASIGRNKQFGLQLSNSNAGQVRQNYIWENGIAIGSDHISYNWFTNNRLTQSDGAGFACDFCNYLTITGNQSYENSRRNIGIYPDWSFRNVNKMIFSSNMMYDWTGTSHTRWGVLIDGASSNIVVRGNIFSNHVIGSISIDPRAKNISSSWNVDRGSTK